MSTLSKFNLSGHLAIITGGAGFLGKRHTEALLDANCDVIAVDINNADLATLKENIKNQYNKEIATYCSDVTNEKDIINLKKDIFDKYKRYPNILINNAAIDAKVDASNLQNSTRLENFSLDQWEREVNVGLSGSFLYCKHFGVEMAKNKTGVILNISSDLGIIAPNQDLYEDNKTDPSNQKVKPVTYSVIKHGIIGLTKYISTYWAKDGVRCNALAPGGVINNQSNDFVNKIQKLIPLGRMASHDEYKATIIYLCSNASSYMNGAVISIDGGRTAW